MLRIAVAGLQHWHVPFYLRALTERADAAIVAVADRHRDVLDRYRKELPDTVRTFADVDDMAAQTGPDLVFAFAPHDEMTALARRLVNRRLPFHMEKPMALCAADLAPVAAAARASGLWHAVALASRAYGVVQALAALGPERGRLVRYHYALLAGDPQRYRDWHCPWMLDPARAGAGPLWNFGPHVVDLFRYLGGQPVVRVAAWWSHAVHRLDIEDCCTLAMTNADGAVGLGEVSYTSLDGYQRLLSVTTDRLQVHTATPGAGEIAFFDGRRDAVNGPDLDELYRMYTNDVLDRFVDARPALATMDDMVAALAVMDAAKVSAARGGEPVRVAAQSEEDRLA